MKVFAISDLHLSTNCAKPMDIFGKSWENYWELIQADWQSKVSDNDVVLIAGDISWAMELANALPDLNAIAQLKGKKVIIKGNHDYWWSSLSRLRNALPNNMFALQNDCIRIGNLLVLGSRLWTVGGLPEAEKAIYEREKIRLRLSLEKMKAQRKDGDIVIAMCHFPPFDVTMKESEFTQLFQEYGVEKVIYGHLHGKDCKAMLRYNLNGIEYLLTSCDQIANKLTLVKEIED
ncbi:MAG: metallophosphoesterase [Clostridia bacterium]